MKKLLMEQSLYDAPAVFKGWLVCLIICFLAIMTSGYVIQKQNECTDYWQCAPQDYTLGNKME